MTDPTIEEIWGAALRDKREERDQTQEELGREVGLSFMTISRLELGKTRVGNARKALLLGAIVGKPPPRPKRVVERQRRLAASEGPDVRPAGGDAAPGGHVVPQDVLEEGTAGAGRQGGKRLRRRQRGQGHG